MNLPRRRTVFCLSIAGLSLAFLSVISAWAFQDTKEAVPFTEPVQPPASFKVEVDQDLIDPDDMQACEQIAILLSTSNQVPNDRLAYYSAVDDPPHFIIEGWGGMIESISDDNGVKVVSVAVRVFLNSLEYGPRTFARSDYSEIYRVSGDSFQYVGFTDPKGWGGKMPPGFVGM